jgi:hypothetical protein
VSQASKGRKVWVGTTVGEFFAREKERELEAVQPWRVDSRARWNVFGVFWS